MISQIGSSNQIAMVSQGLKNAPENHAVSKPDTGKVSNAPNGQKSIEEFVQNASKVLSKINNNIALEYVKELDLVKVLIKNGTTNETIRSIPSESFIQMKLATSSMIGLLLDEKG